MLKEIYEQPKAIKDTMRGRLAENGTEINFTELGWTPEDFTGISKIFIVACGTAYHAGIVGKYYLEIWRASLLKWISPVNSVTATRWLTPTA